MLLLPPMLAWATTASPAEQPKSEPAAVAAKGFEPFNSRAGEHCTPPGTLKGKQKQMHGSNPPNKCPVCPASLGGAFSLLLSPASS